MDDNDKAPDAAFEMLMIEMRDMLVEAEARDRQLEEDIGGYLIGSMPTEPHPLTPLSIEDVLCLPEMGGTFTAAPEFRRKGEHVGDDLIRRAVKQGKLTPLPLGAKKHLFTRKQIKEFLATPCTDQPSPPSRGTAPGKTRSVRPAAGPSPNEGSWTLDAAMRMAAELKKR